MHIAIFIVIHFNCILQKKIFLICNRLEIFHSGSLSQIIRETVQSTYDHLTVMPVCFYLLFVMSPFYTAHFA